MAEQQNTLRRCSRCRRRRPESEFYPSDKYRCKDCSRRQSTLATLRRRTYPEQDVPRSGGGDPCSGCPALHNCRIRVRVSLWVMCETPDDTDFELALAIAPASLRKILLQIGARLKKSTADHLRAEHGLPPAPPDDELLCSNCGLEEIAVPSWKLCAGCYHHWKHHGQHRPKDLARKLLLRQRATERAGGLAARDREIRRLYHRGEMNGPELARRFRVTPARIYQIANQET